MYTRNVQSFDVAIIGLGAMGSAAAHQLAKRGAKVLGIDRFTPPHDRGSSHGETRITRQAIGEGKEYVPLVLRSNELFREIERETGQKLLEQTGGLVLADLENESGQHGVPGFLRSTINAAETFGIEHVVLSTAELKKRFPQFNVHKETGYYEPGAGFLYPERCIDAQLQLAKRHGADVHTNEPVLSYEAHSGDDRVTIRTANGTYEAEKLIMAAGPWMKTFLPEHASDLKIFRQVLFWFDVEGPIEPYQPPQFPIFVWTAGKDIDQLYGFPAIEGSAGGVKVATEQYGTSIDDPDKMIREIAEEEIRRMQKHVVQFLPGLSGKCVKAKACPYTVTPDARFIIDYHPIHQNIIVASPCSGHGFKHSAAIGEALCQMALDGKTALDISSFSLKRLKN